MKNFEVKEVQTKKEQREFLDFPLRLYKDNPYFVPPLYGDEKKIFDPEYAYYEEAEAVYFLAIRDGETVGRISGILQKKGNEIRNEKRVRFTRFDCINDQDVAKALFDAVETWAKKKGMDTVCGPLGFSDVEREGLLVEGFDQLSTFEEQYNADYYGALIEACGYQKEVDWLENKLYLPKDEDIEGLDKLEDMIMRRYKLHYAPAKSTRAFFKQYAVTFFDLVDKSYRKLYQTVPLNPKIIQTLIDNFQLILNKKNFAILMNEQDEPVCIGLCFPSIAEALVGSGGHLRPATLIKLLGAIKKPKVIDLGLIGVDPSYDNHGIGAVFAIRLMKMLRDEKLDHFETNLMLEDNHNIQNLWKRFNVVQHKRRRSYVKTLA